MRAHAILPDHVDHDELAYRGSHKGFQHGPSLLPRKNMIPAWISNNFEQGGAPEWRCSQMPVPVRVGLDQQAAFLLFSGAFGKL